MNLIIINALSVYNFYSVIDVQSPSQLANTCTSCFTVYIPFILNGEHSRTTYRKLMTNLKILVIMRI